MNVVFPAVSVFHNLPSGGGIRVLSDMLNMLSESFRFTVHCPEGSHPIDAAGVKIREWPFPEGTGLRGAGRIAAPLLLPARLAALDGLCRRIAEEMNARPGPALVHNSMFLAAPPILRYLRGPSIYFCYEYPRHLYEPRVVRRTEGRFRHMLLSPLRTLEKRMDSKATAAAGEVITLSSWMKERIREIYGRTATVVRPGVDTDFFSPSDCRRRKMALSVGALWPFKGHGTAVEILAAVPEKERPDLVVVADREYPGYGEKLSEYAERLGVGLEIRRSIPGEELRDLYRLASVVLCMQRNEPYGLVPLEAMACGAPVVAVREGGFIDNLRHGENGLLVNRAREELADAVRSLLLDGRLAEKLGNGGRDFVTSERTREAAAEDLADILGRSAR